MFTEQQVERFMQSVEKTETCWNWTEKERRFHLNGINWKVGRFMWTLHHGELPPNTNVKRTCGNKFCVNPDHLVIEVGRYRFNTIEDKFLHYVEKTDDCWIWKGCLNRDGYGGIVYQHKLYKAHRLSYELYNGQIPNDKVVCHKCNNRKCVNPNHLYAGTPKQNSHDMIEAGTVLYGSKSFKAKITEEDAIEIQRLYAQGGWTHRALGKKFGLTHGSIGNVLRNTGWKHVNLGLSYQHNATSKGETHCFAKLDESKVKEIRKLYEAGNHTYLELGNMYGVGLSAIAKVIKRTHWKHI